MILMPQNPKQTPPPYAAFLEGVSAIMEKAKARNIIGKVRMNILGREADPKGQARLISQWVLANLRYVPDDDDGEGASEQCL